MIRAVFFINENFFTAIVERPLETSMCTNVRNRIYFIGIRIGMRMATVTGQLFRDPEENKTDMELNPALHGSIPCVPN